jgi:cell division protease FtsH
MSDPKSPQEPKAPNPRSGATGEPGGFNWRLILVFSVALFILGIAFWGGPGSTATKKISYAEFKNRWEQGRVVTANDEFPLKVITKESPYEATIQGFAMPIVAPKEPVKTTPVAFQVPVNVFTGDELKDVLRGHARYLLVNSLPETPEATVMSLQDLRKAMAFNEVVLNNPEQPLQVLNLRGSNEAVITGVRNVPATRPVFNSDKKTFEPFEFSVPTLVMSTEIRDLLGNQAQYDPDRGVLKGVIYTFLPIMILLLVFFFLFRSQMKSAGRGAMNFGKSKAKLLAMDRNKVTFKDVAGIQEAKEELWEIVDFLRDPRKFQKLGGSIPKGVLMVGAPGTGKTLLARAIAGEADVPFFSISGSDFVEMFVGVGASRVRDMFEQGKKQAPCLIFIDEIDAVGRHRGHGVGGGHDEREQTLNALLVEMDGFDTQEGVIIIAATNRPDVLDPALLRPGRFDRQVTVSLPDVNGRAEILAVHAKRIKLSANVDLSLIARGTPGFSGAELANLINEAALLAARKALNSVTLAELEEARDKVRWGRERRSLALSEKEKENTAFHEAGHAVLNELLEHTDPLHKVTIIPRGPSLGSTMFLPEEDKFTHRRDELLDQLVVAMGGRVAEELVFGNVTNGAVGDIRMATNIARKMVCEWGMSDDLGMVEYGENRGEVFLARDMAGSKNYSEDTAQKIDEEIKRLIDVAYARARSMLNERRELLDLIARALLEYETLDASHIRDLMDTGRMSNPPTMPKPPEIPDDLRKKPVKKVVEEGRDNDGPLAGDVIGAPA